MRLFLLFILCSFNLLSQTPWELFNSKSELFFGVPNAVAGSTVDLNGLKIDSVKYSGGDSIYYHYRIVESVYSGTTMCLNNIAANWTGKTTIRKANGDFIFFNSVGDTLLIKSFAQVGETWRYYKYPVGLDYIMATVSQKTFMPVFGPNIDSVKIISFQAYNNLNQPIPHAYNSKQFILSKNHGLIKTGMFNKFPLDNSMYSRYNGKRMKRADVYNYSVGDEFHITNYHYGMSNLPVFDSWLAKRIIGKEQISPQLVTYTLIGQYATTFSIYPVSTFTESFNNLQSDITSVMPGHRNNGNAEKRVYELINYSTPCEAMVIGNKNINTLLSSDRDSCALPYSVTNFSEVNYSMEGVSENLIYKGPYQIQFNWRSVTYHLKNNISCYGDIDFTIGMNENKQNVRLKIFPNPATEKLFIEMYDNSKWHDYKIRVCDYIGKLLIEENIDSKSIIQSISLAKLAPGVYLVEIKDELGRVIEVKKIYKE